MIPLETERLILREFTISQNMKSEIEVFENKPGHFNAQVDIATLKMLCKTFSPKNSILQRGI